MGLAERYPVRYTVKEWERWEGDWELVEGVPYAMASPSPLNQILLSAIVALIRIQMNKCENCHIAVELDWYISEDTVVRPDLLVFCGDIPKKLTQRPELVLEVVSPSTKLMDEGLKRELYKSLQVPYYLLVYPEEKSIVCLELFGKEYIEKKDRLFKVNQCQVELPFEEVETVDKNYKKNI
jgi:Uma2 family endonuclease